jgi:hypothetical protein
MQNHKFKPITQGSKICCFKEGNESCYKPKLHEYHLDDLTPDDITRGIGKALGRNHEIQVVDGLPWTPEIDYVASNEVRHATQPSFVTPISSKLANLDTREPDCYGHICPNCNNKWFHSYKCWPGTKENMHCPAHFGQVVVEMNRERDVNDLLNTRVTTAKDIAELILEHRQFVVLEASKSDDFHSWCGAHIRNLRELSEKINAKISATRSAELELSIAENSKLTVEEIEQYKRDAKKRKKAESANAEDLAKKEWKGQLKDLIAAIGDKDLAEMKLKQLWTSKNKEIPS